ncbi:MAG: hemerythrin domain-containing protein [Deltaproteobacteria bacterium]|nr:hemerythrin domain-containing protein [Deltaproteobacteria bacterium]
MSDLCVEVLDHHETFQTPLADAISAAYQLVLDPTNRDAVGQMRVAWRFVCDDALPHMAQEEVTVFPRAISSGVPADTLDVLSMEHRALRALAEELRDRGMDRDVPPDDEGALLLLRFMQSFDAHVQREEAIFALYAGTDAVRTRRQRQRYAHARNVSGT